MTFEISRRNLIVGAGALAATPALAAAATPDLQSVLDYVANQNTTGFLVVQNGKTLVEKNWPLPADAEGFRATFTYGKTADGALLEDVASQQKSFVSMLVAVAIDKGLIDVEKPVVDYIGAGWSKASPDQERAIRVIHLLNMASGLNEQFGYVAPAGTQFFYNTAVYAVTKRVLAAAAKTPLERITHDWLTAPAGMANTAWRESPAAFANVGNATGLVTCPRDVATFGQIILDRGKAADGRRIVSEANLAAMFARSATNSVLWPALVAERRFGDGPSGRRQDSRPADPGRRARLGRRSRGPRSATVRRAQPQAGRRAHGPGRFRQGLRPAAVAAAVQGARLIEPIFCRLFRKTRGQAANLALGSRP
jgi:CubicO group peptidase (beta-lactamase class C family)